MVCRRSSPAVQQQQGVKAHHKDIPLHEYFTDLLINDVVLLRNSVCCEIRQAWPVACEPGRSICVPCVNRLSASALTIVSWPAVPRGWYCGPRLNYISATG